MAVACHDLSAEVVTKSFLKSAAFAMLDCGRVDVLDPAATLLGAEGINVRNEQVIELEGKHFGENIHFSGVGIPI